MGKLNPEQSKIFCLQGILTKTNSDLLVELESNSGEMLFSNLYTWEELTDVLESVTGRPYWIGKIEYDVVVTEEALEQAVATSIGIISRHEVFH